MRSCCSGSMRRGRSCRSCSASRCSTCCRTTASPTTTASSTASTSSRTFSTARQGVSPTTEVSSAGEIFSAEVVQLLSLLVWGTSAIAVLMSRTPPRTGRAAGRARVRTVRAAARAVVRRRGDLPGLPVLRAVVRLPGLPPTAGGAEDSHGRRRRARRSSISVAAFVGMQGEHGQLTFDHFTPDEVAATTYFYQHAPAGALLIEPADNMPDALDRAVRRRQRWYRSVAVESVLPTDRNTITGRRHGTDRRILHRLSVCGVRRAWPRARRTTRITLGTFRMGCSRTFKLPWTRHRSGK